MGGFFQLLVILIVHIFVFIVFMILIGSGKLFAFVLVESKL